METWRGMENRWPRRPVGSNPTPAAKFSIANFRFRIAESERSSPAFSDVLPVILTVWVILSCGEVREWLIRAAC